VCVRRLDSCYKADQTADYEQDLLLRNKNCRKIEAYFAFETKEKAAAFEAYLKTGSGHAFAKRHF
jgi:hypothetical protein